MSEKLLLDRDNYRKIKAKSREEMAEFLTDIYKDGWRDGKDEALKETQTVSIDFDKMRADIGAIKGIGETRLDQIMDIIQNYLTTK